MINAQGESAVASSDRKREQVELKAGKLEKNLKLMKNLTMMKKKKIQQSCEE